MESGRKVVLGDVWAELQQPPFGFYNTIACGVLLGFVFSCYKDSAYSWTDSSQGTFVLNESNLKTLPKVKELDAEYSKLLTEKKALYPDYRKAKDEMQELLRAQRNVELFFAEEKNTTEKTQSR